MRFEGTARVRWNFCGLQSLGAQLTFCLGQVLLRDRTVDTAVRSTLTSFIHSYLIDNEDSRPEENPHSVVVFPADNGVRAR